MCIILLKPKDKTFSPDLVERMYDMGNKDGFGMMWVEEDRVKTEKSMSSGLILKDLYKDRMDTDIAVHVRKATFGEKDIANCHPYCVLDIDMGHKIDLYMMHNGTIREVQIDKKMSDSYNFATKFLRNLLAKGNNYKLIQDPEFQFFLAGIIGPNKLLFLDNKKKFTIINSDLGSYHSSGCWVSTKEDIKVWEPIKQYLPRASTTTVPSHIASHVSQSNTDPNNKGKWVADQDLKLHFIPENAIPKANIEEATVTIDDTAKVDGTDNGTPLRLDEVDEEGLDELMRKFPQMAVTEVEKFVIDFQKEALVLLIKNTDKHPGELDKMVKLDPWEASRALILASKVKYGETSNVSLN